LLNHFHAVPKNPTRVVIMGAGGFVGGAIRRRLERRGVETLPLSRSRVDLLRPDGGATLAAELRSDDALVAVSAIAPVRTPTMLRDNIIMIEAMAEALSKSPVSHVLNIGSDAIYHDSPDPLSESSCRAPGSLHGVMHLIREIMLADAAGQTPFASLRPTLIYGADDPHDGYGPNRFRRLAEKGEAITLFGDGEERRDHVWVEDVAELAVRMLLHRSSGALNAATGTVISFREVAEATVAEIDPHVEIKPTSRTGPMPHNGYRPFDPAATRAAFPDFTYTAPLDGIPKARAAWRE